jgi:hypothetical protein
MHEKRAPSGSPISVRQFAELFSIYGPVRWSPAGWRPIAVPGLAYAGNKEALLIGGLLLWWWLVHAVLGGEPQRY